MKMFVCRHCNQEYPFIPAIIIFHYNEKCKEDSLNSVMSPNNEEKGSR